MNNVCERALRIVYDDHNSSYSDLLMTKYECTNDQQNINVLMKEIDTFEKHLSPLLIHEMFQVHTTNYNLRHFQKTANTKNNSVKMRLETISYHAPQLWNLIPTEIKDAFKMHCQCRFCVTCMLQN